MARASLHPGRQPNQCAIERALAVVRHRAAAFVHRPVIDDRLRNRSAVDTYPPEYRPGCAPHSTRGLRPSRPGCGTLRHRPCNCPADTSYPHRRYCREFRQWTSSSNRHPRIASSWFRRMFRPGEPIDWRVQSSRSSRSRPYRRWIGQNRRHRLRGRPRFPAPNPIPRRRYPGENR